MMYIYFHVIFSFHIYFSGLIAVAYLLDLLIYLSHYLEVLKRLQN